MLYLPLREDSSYSICEKLRGSCTLNMRALENSLEHVREQQLKAIELVTQTPILLVD